MSDKNIPKLPTEELDEKLFRLLVASVKDYAIFMIDPNGYILTWNKGAEHIKGYSEDEILGKHISQFYTPKDNASNELRRNLNIALKNGMYETEGWRIRKDRSLFWAHVVFTTVYNDEGHLVGFAKVTRDITERKRAEEKKAALNAELEKNVKANTKKILTNELKFRKLIENSQDGIALLDRQLKTIYRSFSAERITGWANEERVEHDFRNIVHPDDMPIINKAFADIFSRPDTPAVCVHRIKHKFGYYIWAECMMKNMLDDVYINAIVCNFRDVTQRKTAEEEIQKSHAQLQEASATQRAILDALPPSIVLLNDKCRIVAVNEAWKRSPLVSDLPDYGVGYDYRPVTEKAISTDKTSNSRLAAGIKDVVSGAKKEFKMEYGCRVHKEVLWYQVVAAPLADGHQKGAVVLHIDITRRKLAEESLLQSEANLRSVFENTDLSIVLLDTNLRVVSFNNIARDLSVKNFGKKLKKGASAFNYFPKERHQVIEQIAEKVSNHEKVCYETFYEFDEIEWFEVRWVGVADTENQNIGLILTLKNITEQKKATIERERITADLMQRNKDLEQFTYIVSHNLRAPVANIIGLSNLMQELEIEDEETESVVKALCTSVNNLDKVIIDLNNILQVNRNLNEEFERVDLNTLVNDIKDSIRQWMTKDNVTIVTNFDGASHITTLKTYIHSIFYNLITNSIKYRRPDVPPVIDIHATVSGDRVIILYTDNGRGIDMSKHATDLFGLYKRFDYSVEGKGMGLFMVKMQVQSLKGIITVSSEPNQGTQFKIEFPLS